MMRFLGYTLVTPDMGMGSEGYGGYYDFMVCEGRTELEAVENWVRKVNEKGGTKYEFSPDKLHFDSDGNPYFRDYFVINFIRLPGEDVYHPREIKLDYKD